MSQVAAPPDPDEDPDSADEVTEDEADLEDDVATEFDVPEVVAEDSLDEAPPALVPASSPSPERSSTPRIAPHASGARGIARSRALAMDRRVKDASRVVRI